MTEDTSPKGGDERVFSKNGITTDAEASIKHEAEQALRAKIEAEVRRDIEAKIRAEEEAKERQRKLENHTPRRSRRYSKGVAQQDTKPIEPNMSLVSIQEVKSKKEIQEVLNRKPDNRMSDLAWTKLHSLGETSIDKLQKIMERKDFDKLKLTDQLKIIEMAFVRAYGSPESGARRSTLEAAKIKASGNSQAGNALSRLAHRAQFPELRLRDGVDTQPSEEEGD